MPQLPKCEQCEARLKTAYTYKPNGKPGEVVPIAIACESGHYTLPLPDAWKVYPSGTSRPVLIRGKDRVCRVWGVARWDRKKIAISKKQEVSQ